MKTYVINLERSRDRRTYMEGLLEKLPFLSAEFIAAVDGRVMSEEEKRERFDSERFKKRYAKEVRPGEIGCTLSHQKCYQLLLKSDEKCVLILEDDVVFSRDISGIIARTEKWMDTEVPCILLLSGWFWYSGTEAFYDTFRLARVRDAFLTHAYVINRAAADLLIEKCPCITADDWRYIQKKGVRLRAVLPHLIDQNWSGECPTLINTGKEDSLRGYWKVKIKRKWHVVVLKMYQWFGKFEKA